ncbi:MAG: hypothetical protein AAF125_05295 [Chloroflexota bacterium]
MPYLMRMKVGPKADGLSTSEYHELGRVFDMREKEVFIHGEPVGWEEIEEVELVVAPQVGGLSSWILSKFVDMQDRYHLGIYLKRDEAVLANISKPQALYALNAIAYNAPNLVRYNGPDGFAPLTGY